jgi:hypothetical protein
MYVREEMIIFWYKQHKYISKYYIIQWTHIKHIILLVQEHATPIPQDQLPNSNKIYLGKFIEYIGFHKEKRDIIPDPYKIYTFEHLSSHKI